MGFETRFFFRCTDESAPLSAFPSFSDAKVLGTMVCGGPSGAVSPAAASVAAQVAAAAASLIADDCEDRADEYVPLPTPHGHLVGLKGRGGKKNKVEIKIGLPASTAPTSASSVAPLQRWVKYAEKIKKGGIHSAAGVSEWLGGLAREAGKSGGEGTDAVLLQWALGIVAATAASAQPELPIVTVTKQRRCGSLKAAGAGGASLQVDFEETDVVFSVKRAAGERAVLFRSWAFESADPAASSAGSLLSEIAAGWAPRFQHVIAERGPAAPALQSAVASYPALVQKVAFDFFPAKPPA